MANADGLRGLAEEMANAYKERVQCISGIKQDVAAIEQETGNMLGAFDKAHNQMAKTLTADLAKFKADLDAAEGDRKKTDQAEIAETKDYIVDLRDKAQELVNECDKAHRKMAKALTAELARFKSDLDAAEGDRKKTDQTEIAERKDYISHLRHSAQQMLDEFDKAHQQMAKNLSDILAGVRPELESAESDRKSAVQAEMAAVKAETRKTAAAWKGLLAKMQSGGHRAAITGPSKVKAAPKAKPVKKVEAEGADLEDEVLDLLEENPDGLKMTEIADSLGIKPWQSLIPVVRELLDDGKVAKEGSIYQIH
jgi:uncharacterized coiled-coil DUF342 family protein